MKFAVYLILVLFQLVLFSGNAKPQAVFNSQPPNPSSVLEFENLTLQWSYDLQGNGVFLAAISDVTGGTVGPPTVVLKRQGGDATAQPGYEGLFTATVSDNQTTLTILSVPRSDSGKKYRLTLTVDVTFTVLQSDVVEINVLYEPVITHISENQTVKCGSVFLNCSADGKPAPNITWTKLSDNSIVTMPHNITGSQDEGEYKCTANNSIGMPASAYVFISVQCPPEIDHVSVDQDICEGSNVTLSCNATGAPTPSITWTRVADDGTVIEELTAMDGVYVMYNITRNLNGTYRCTANNTVGTVNETVLVTVRYAAYIYEIVNTSNTVIEGGSFNMTCHASGDPVPTDYMYTWVKTKDNTVQSNGTVLMFPNISRNDDGLYRCEVENRCGNDSRSQSVTVHFPPEIDHVTMDQDICEGSNVTLRCIATGAPKPSVTWRRVLENGTDIEELTAADGVFFMHNITRNLNGTVYRCTASNPIGNDSRTVQVTVRHAASIGQFFNSSNTVNEGGFFSMTCGASGDPQPTNYTWIKTENGRQYSGSVLNFSNISRGNAGRYRCEVENRCGKDSRDQTVDVYFAPENVTLSTNLSTTDKVCADVEVNFTCTVEDANPAVDKYTLYENGREVQKMESSGVLIRPLKTGGQVTYKCEANNSVNAAGSSDISFTVEVPASVMIENNTVVVQEGGNVTLVCSASGFPSPNVAWFNASNYLTTASSILRFPNISRHSGGNYSCSASNACGNDSKIAHIDVQYAAYDTSNEASRNVSVRRGNVHQFSCQVDGNPEPNITWYRESEPSGTAKSSGRLFNASEEGCYTCSAGNSLGIPVDITYCLAFETLAAPIKTTQTTPPGQVCEETFSKNTDCSMTLELIIVIVVCGVLVFVFLVGVIAWWIHKRRKCRKDPRIHHSEADESLQEVNPYSQSNQGYAHSGPPSANGAEQAAAAAVPTYSVVDKSKKKKNAEEKVPDYAVVDKSKKKKKEIPLYASVDKSKKKKKDDQNLYDNVEEPKKRKPGELLYADLGDFKPEAMPPVATSPQALPPVKRAPPQEKTIYADIAQFIKGDANLPQNESQQGSAMQPQDASKGGDEEKNTETAIQVGNPKSQGNHGCADSKPPSADGTEKAAASAVPTYAVVDKSNEKKKDPKEKVPEYAVVDKSKKKKKEKKEDDLNLCDSVDKPKKKRRPGELPYANLGDTNKKEMPPVATSPKALPSLKRVEPYLKMDCAEITQLLGETTLQNKSDQDSEMKPQGTSKGGDEGGNTETQM